MSNQWAMGYKFWAKDKFKPPTNGEWYLGADYQQYLTSDHPGNFVAFDVVQAQGALAGGEPGAILGRRRRHVVRTRLHRGHARLLHGARCAHREPCSGSSRPARASSAARSPTSSMDGSTRGPIRRNRRRHDLLLQGAEGRKPVGVRARWRGPARVPTGTETNLTTRMGAPPKVGEPGSTLGGRVLPGYGFPATDGTSPIQGEAPPQPTAASAVGDADGERRMRLPPVSDSIAHAASAVTRLAGRVARTSFRSCPERSRVRRRRRQRTPGDADARLRVRPHS